MESVILVVHLLIAVALVGVILIQRSEGGGLGIGGGTMGGMMSTRGTANLLTRTTGILAGSFFATSIVLAILAGAHSKPTSIIDTLPTAIPALPAAPAQPAPPVSQ
ncbi:preprotein translocase subunit SecG [Azospirillum cavernae]|jgi:preprotein translocase subunit SecG|uniref:Protein-export membrane protein SecG n=1 Tax=Azospirillum cavernae TaxID=2320860 RepID=A0A418W200_9PROT|nr:MULTISPECIES: preprotein translocase subunit SecG [Azospirillum]RJF84045.1 preprotein translocase subunit SecG [Azospirillum cavernae]